MLAECSSGTCCCKSTCKAFCNCNIVRYTSGKARAVMHVVYSGGHLPEQVSFALCNRRVDEMWGVVVVDGTLRERGQWWADWTQEGMDVTVLVCDALHISSSWFPTAYYCHIVKSSNSPSRFSEYLAKWKQQFLSIIYKDRYRKEFLKNLIFFLKK